MTALEHGRSKPPADYDAIRDWRPAKLLDHHYSGGHLTALAADELFFTARGVYFAETIQGSGIGAAFWLIYRHLEMDYLAEAFLGEPVRTGVRTIGRSKRSLTLLQVLQALPEAGIRRTIAVGRLVVVAFDVANRVPVEVPDSLWRAIESFEGPIGT